MTTGRRTAAATGLLTGLAMAALLIAAMRVPASSQPLGADLRLAVEERGEVHISGDGALLSARGLLPGEQVRGAVELRNITSKALDVRLRASGPRTDLDEALAVELRTGGRTLTRGTLGELRRRRSGRALHLAVRGRRTVRARARLREGTPFAGRGARVQLALDVRAAP